MTLNIPPQHGVIMYGQGPDGSLKPLQTDSNGDVLVGASSGFTSVLSFARTADTNAYTAGDVEGTGTGAAGAALEFDNIGPAAGGEVMITSTGLEHDITAVPSGMTSYRLHLYGVTPPSALGDNAAWDLPSGDRASYLGYVDLGTPVDVGSTLYVKTDGNNVQITVPAGGKVFGYLVTNGGYTPASATVRKITLHSVAL